MRPGPAYIPIDPDWLRDAYETDGRSIRAIASELGTSRNTVWRSLQRFGIEPRTRRKERHEALP
jgi:transposase